MGNLRGFIVDCSTLWRVIIGDEKVEDWWAKVSNYGPSKWQLLLAILSIIASSVIAIVVTGKWGEFIGLLNSSTDSVVSMIFSTHFLLASILVLTSVTFLHVRRAIFKFDLNRGDQER